MAHFARRTHWLYRKGAQKASLSFKRGRTLRKEAGPVGKGEAKKRGRASGQEAGPVEKGEAKKGGRVSGQEAGPVGKG